MWGAFGLYSYSNGNVFVYVMLSVLVLYLICLDFRGDCTRLYSCIVRYVYGFALDRLLTLYLYVLDCNWFCL